MLGEVLDFMRLIWALDHGLQRTSKSMAATMGLTGTQRLVLRIVGRYPGISAGRLAQVLYLHPSTLTGVLSRLERRDLLHRTKDVRDARRSLLKLTPRGWRLNEPAAGTVESSVRRALGKFTGRQLQTAREVLVAVAGDLLEQTAPRQATERTTAGERRRPLPGSEGS
ncbi:MAG: MarR family transcriptional regulator [Candidatus Riflebacteria bacterium]|nr:MarR family transcriptional regulator [Candidatus Riflebacteria bacterium]